jgi:hypothetical protein
MKADVGWTGAMVGPQKPSRPKAASRRIVRLSSTRWRILLIGLLLVVFSTSLSIFSGEDNRNYLMIGVLMCMTPFVIFDIPSVISVPRIIAVVPFLVYMSVVNIINYETLRFSTFMFTLLFCCTFIYYVALVTRSRPPFDYLAKICRLIIIGYFVVLIAQQVAVIGGLPVPNKISSVEEQFRLNSLAPEPSHAARIMTMVMYLFMVAKAAAGRQAISFSSLLRTDRTMVLAYVYPMLSMGSASGMLFIAALAMQFMRPRDILWMALFVIAALAAIEFVDYEPLNRSLAFIEALATFDQQKMIIADHSGALRVIPYFVYADRFDLTDLAYWFGGGSGFESSYFRGWIPGVRDELTGSGSLATILLAFGLVGGACFLLLFMTFCFSRRHWLGTVLWLVMVTSSPLNSQIFWLSLMILTTIVYIDSHGAIAPRRAQEGMRSE